MEALAGGRGILKNIKLLLILLFCALFVDAMLVTSQFSVVRGSIKVFDREGVLIYESVNGLEGYQTPIEISELPDVTKQAFIVAEDRRFYKHLGFDPISMVRALVSNFKSGGIVSGGSTITQQVARANMVSPEMFGSNKFMRKIREINSAIYLEIFYTKDEILEKYLNTIYLGNNSYGIAAASNTYFSKPASQLSLSESAALAGSVKSPVVLNPLVGTASISSRNNVLELMYQNGDITKETLDESLAYPLGVTPSARQNVFIHFVEYALGETMTKLDLKSRESLQGFSIYTTLSASLSKQALDSARNQVATLKEKNRITNAAVVVLDPKDSGILVMNGSVDYFDESIDGAVNIALAHRQPGSALKPFTYGQAFYEGLLTPDDIILDQKTTFIDKKGDNFSPYNYNGLFNGEVSVRVALASSLNLPAVKVLEMVGVDDMVGAAKRAGITTLDNPDRYDLSVTLGGGEVRLLDLTNAYTSLARGGEFKEAYSVNKVVNHKGDVLFQHVDVAGTPVWDEKSEIVADMLTSVLSDPAAKVMGFGRNNVLNLPFVAASKTGTTTDWHDNWTFGYTKDFVTGVWVGNSNNMPMYDIDGVTGAGPIWRQTMLEAYEYFGNKNRPVNMLSSLSSVVSLEEAAVMPEQQVALLILNPSKNDEYITIPGETTFERILFETTTRPDVKSVQFYLNGNLKHTVSEKDHFKYLWLPEKGYFVLVAKFYDETQKLLGEDTTSFYVY